MLNWYDLERSNRAPQRLMVTKQNSRIAVVGIGHELRNDDAIGVIIARRLQEQIRNQSSSSLRHRLLIVDAGPAPENFTGALRQFAPDKILLVDAANMGETPGTVAWVDWQLAIGDTLSTHSLPISVWARYLTDELACEVALIGIQPANTCFGEKLSPALEQVAESLPAELLRLLDHNEEKIIPVKYERSRGHVRSKDRNEL